MIFWKTFVEKRNRNCVPLKCKEVIISHASNFSECNEKHIGNI